MAILERRTKEIAETPKELGEFDLKQLVAGLSLDVYRLKKTAIPLMGDHNGAGT